MNTLVMFLVALNPPTIAAALPPSVRMRATAIAALITAAVVTLAAGLSEPALDALDVSEPTFRVTAGIVLGVASIRWVAVGATARVADDPPAVLLLPLLLTPQLIAVAITAGASDGAATAGIGVAVALLTGVIASIWRSPENVFWTWTGRLVAMAGLAIALSLVVDGVKTV
jgi:small neutral amino acid transporter SnatA (MarC family)